MAKKKSEDSKKDIIKNIKEHLYLPIQHITEMPRITIPWSPGFDEATGGGIVSGSMVNLSGSYKVGKTSSLLQFARNCQKPEYGGIHWGVEAAKAKGIEPGRPIVYVNTEGRLNKRDVMSVPGMNYAPDKFMLITSTADETLYLEDYFTRIEQTIEMYPGCVIILDSVGAMCTKTVAAVTDGGQVRDNAALLSRAWMRRVGQLLMPKDIILLNVLHVVTNTGAKPGQSTKSVTGGVGVQFGANYILSITWTEPTDDHTGAIIHLQGGHSELGTPKMESMAYLRFGKGLWNSYELVNLCTVADCNNLFGIGKSGSWYNINPELTGSDKPVKLQGMSSVATWFDENPKAYNKLYKAYANANWGNRKLYQ